ncbi:SDR family oxidoreductase [Novosphingobium sp. PASSN1]|uniref:SDR family oxidoreductase n=1 Tax=Novosphingobium sp. PASSN1 TaxID=2015561 RepID=UPI0025F7D7BE|nr:SDR family oxidoreductase [Novosphingobium sp. PASSN1]
MAIIGLRGLGIACARRLGAGRTLVLGDLNPETLRSIAETLAAEGHKVVAQQVDVTDVASVEAFAAKAAGAGRLLSLVLAAGLSPHMGTPEKIFAVNMIGTISVLDAFLPLAEKGTVAVVIASNAGYLAPVPASTERKLALDPPETLMAAVSEVEGWDNGLGAYWLSKRANQVRIEAAAPVWGKRGARIVSVSPGIMATPMSAFERDAGSQISEAIANAPAARIGLPDDIAAAVAWLVGPEASFVTGTDFLIDGGMTSALKWTCFETQNPAG